MPTLAQCEYILTYEPVWTSSKNTFVSDGIDNEFCDYVRVPYIVSKNVKRSSS